jgi:hypothetical protein
MKTSENKEKSNPELVRGKTGAGEAFIRIRQLDPRSCASLSWREVSSS